MSRSIAITRTQFAPATLADLARAAIVTGCALALILAGPVLPF